MYEYTYHITLDDGQSVSARTIGQNRFIEMMKCIEKVNQDYASDYNNISKVELKEVKILGGIH